MRSGGLFFITVLLTLAVLATPAEAQSWSFAVLGDSRGDGNGVNTEILADLADEVAASGAEFVLFPGDLITGSSSNSVTQSQLNQWRATMAPIYDANIDVYPVAGNHEWQCAGLAAIWQSTFPELPGNGPAGEGKLTYSFTHRNAFVAALDGYSGHGKRIDQTWLDAQLAANGQPHVFAFSHEPAYSVDHNDCLGDYPADRDEFMGSLAAEGGRTYFCGHDHFYNHAMIDDVDGVEMHQFLIGTAGAPLRNWDGLYNGDNGGATVGNVDHDKSYGYSLVEIDGLDVTLTYMERLSAGNYAAGDVFQYTVPEPATAAVLLAGASLLIRCRKPRR